MGADMNWVIEFVTVYEEKVIGRVSYGTDGLVVDPAVHTVVDGMTPAEIEESYDGWSNGYVSARKVTD
jgi:hypothetical protein